jgi:general stress protein CsbA
MKPADSENAYVGSWKFFEDVMSLLIGKLAIAKMNSSIAGKN